ncbi:hypothetical protein M5D96_010511 [Drosophila gunungcola]|uniref:Uncharacterized protein n=1 Tax=Drosophila gunungcola TaxID=103775 RepID=A0A9Q0BM64_9MUSC|nr:hypothetical protein M5D96_010511 [Drosophila gunungcola]
MGALFNQTDCRTPSSCRYPYQASVWQASLLPSGSFKRADVFAVASVRRQPSHSADDPKRTADLRPLTSKVRSRSQFLPRCHRDFERFRTVLCFVSAVIPRIGYKKKKTE